MAPQALQFPPEVKSGNCITVPVRLVRQSGLIMPEISQTTMENFVLRTLNVTSN